MPSPQTTLAARRRFVASALAVSLFSAAGSAPAAVSDAAFLTAFQQLQAGQKGDSAAVERAADQFNELLKADPADPLLMAYAGAATTLKAASTLLPWKKMSYAEDGLAQIDKALALLQPTHDNQLVNHVPVSLQTRFVAASTFLNLPKLFNRGPRGNKLLADVQASPLMEQAPAGFQGAVLLRAAMQAAKEERPDEARRVFGQIIERGLPRAEAAKLQLAGLPQ